jgi:hypothetical protein
LGSLPAGVPQKKVQIVDTTIPVIEYRGQRVITLAIMDVIHHRPDGTAKRAFQTYKDRLEEGKHFYLVDYTQKNEFRSFEIDVPPRGLTVLTERGYSMLVKSFTDDFAWEVQEQLSDSYFDNQKPMSTAEFLVQQANLILEHENQIKALREHQHRTDQHLVETNQKIRALSEKADEAFEAASAALQHKFGRSDYFTVMAFSSTLGVSLDLTMAKTYGARASQLSRQQDMQIMKVPDERFGKVNSYHSSILKQVFDDLT